MIRTTEDISPNQFGSIPNRRLAHPARTMAPPTLTEDDTGKPVINAAGDQIGIVTQVEDGTAHVDPNPDTIVKMKSKLGWGDATDGVTYELPRSEVATVRDGEIHLDV